MLLGTSAILGRPLRDAVQWRLYDSNRPRPHHTSGRRVLADRRAGRGRGDDNLGRLVHLKTASPVDDLDADHFPLLHDCLQRRLPLGQGDGRRGVGSISRPINKPEELAARSF